MSPSDASAGHSAAVSGIISRLAIVFREVDLYKELVGCQNDNAQRLLDLFQWLLDTPDLDIWFRRSLIVATQRLAATSGLYPMCYELKDIVADNEDPVTFGGFADIYKANFNGQKVCLKAIRIYQDTKDEQFLKRFAKEAILWGQLSHPNVLPIYGLHRFRRRFCLVSPWMEEGDIEHYLKQRPSGPRVQFAIDVARGLSYLHKSGIIHGDLKSGNILIDGRGGARLADFGISSVSDSQIPSWTSHSSAASKGGSVRWQAPELFDTETDDFVKNSKASDVYAWSCVCYEIFTGDVPFYKLRDTAVIVQVMRGARPERPPESSLSWSVWGLTKDLWALMQDCWKETPAHRPTMDQVLERLIHPSRHPRDFHDDHFSDGDSVLSPSKFRRRMTQPDDLVTSLKEFRSLLPNDSLIESLLGKENDDLFGFPPRRHIAALVMGEDGAFMRQSLLQTEITSRSENEEEIVALDVMGTPSTKAACVRCDGLGLKCESRNDSGPCSRCLLGGHECMMKIINEHRTSVEREDLLDIIREQRTQIESLRVQLQAHTRGEQQPAIRVGMSGLNDSDVSKLSHGTGDWSPPPISLTENSSVKLPRSESPEMPALESDVESDDDFLDFEGFHSETMDSGSIANGTAKAKPMARACARCRELKTKCASTSDTGPCQRCLNSGRECTFPAQITPRAPSKRERLLESIRAQSREIKRLMEQLEVAGTHDGRALAAA